MKYRIGSFVVLGLATVVLSAAESAKRAITHEDLWLMSRGVEPGRDAGRVFFET